MSEEASMRFGLHQATATESSKDAQDTEDANKESNNRFEDTCVSSSTSDAVHPTQKLNENTFRDTWKATSTSTPLNPFKKQTETRFEDPSSSTDVVQPPENLYELYTDTDEQVSTTTDDNEKKEEDYWLDPQRLRSVPALKRTINQSKPCPPTTFFGKLHQNSPLAYTGYEKESLPIVGEGSPRSWEDFLQMRMQNVEKPLDLMKVKDSLPLKPSKESLEKEKSNKETAFKEIIEKRDMKAWEMPQKNNDSPPSKEDSPGSKDSRINLDVPHIQACASMLKPISAKEKDSPLLLGTDCPSSPSQASLSLHNTQFYSIDSPPSPNEVYPPSPSKVSPPSPSKDFIPSQIKTTLLSHSKDSVPSHNKDSVSLLSKNSHSHSKDFPLHIKDPVPPHSKDSDIKSSPYSHIKYIPSSYGNDSVSHGQNSAPSHDKDSNLHNQDYLHSYSKYSSPADEAPRYLKPKNNNAAVKPKATHQEEQKKDLAKLTEPYDPEFPGMISQLPTKELNADNLDMIRGMPTARVNHMYKWLYSQSLNDNEYEQKVMELLPEYSLIVYSDAEEDMELEQEEHEEAQEGSVNKSTGNMDALIDCFQSLRFNEAIPDCCLTDSVFLVDKPQSAVSRKCKLPPMPLEDICPVKEYLKILVTHVYTPFQFWFNFVNKTYDTSVLHEMQMEMRAIYSDKNSEYFNTLPRCLLKADYLCAIQSEDGWRRARITATPPSAVATVSIYYVDYGFGGDVSAAELRYLPETFAEKPALAIRGSLSYIHPLGPHWSPDSMQQFQRLIIGKEMFAHVVELDLIERIVFLRISLNQEFFPSVNKMLVDANLAGRSQHYDFEKIKDNFGIRHRYLRERLPSHEMLETRVFPILDDEFEVAFDSIIYSPAFGKFKVPRLTKGYDALRQALVSWMPAYRQEMERWAALYNEAKAKQKLALSEAREAWLLRKEQETEKERNQSISELIEKMEVLNLCEPMEGVTEEGKGIALVEPAKMEEGAPKAADRANETTQTGNIKID
ncbi:hypothetical protein KR032_004866 [Drosophila birchii]|nr:hypothetical protein KR032_004866 [Drosophila birchii]